MPSRDDAVTRAIDHLESGTFEADLGRRVAIASESRITERPGTGLGR